MTKEPTDFATFFAQRTGNPRPHSYQCRLACGPTSQPDLPDTLRGGATCNSQLISIPTGLGKTAAVVLSWLWNRVHLRSSDWPRRLVYCLPMRTLVEQTEAEVRRWVGDAIWDGSPATRKDRVGVHLGWKPPDSR